MAYMEQVAFIMHHYQNCPKTFCRSLCYFINFCKTVYGKQVQVHTNFLQTALLWINVSKSRNYPTVFGDKIFKKSLSLGTDWYQVTDRHDLHITHSSTRTCQKGLHASGLKGVQPIYYSILLYSILTGYLTIISCHPVLKIIFLAFISNHNFNDLPQFSRPRLLLSSPYDYNCHDTAGSSSVCWEIPPLSFLNPNAPTYLHEPVPALHQDNKLRPSITFWNKLIDSLYRTCHPVPKSLWLLNQHISSYTQSLQATCHVLWQRTQLNVNHTEIYLTNCEIHIWNEDKVFVLVKTMHIPCIVSGASNLWTTFLVLTINVSRPNQSFKIYLMLWKLDNILKKGGTKSCSSPKRGQA